MKAKHQRLWLVVGALTALGGAGVLAFSTLGEKGQPPLTRSGWAAWLKKARSCETAKPSASW
jgi:hypothetical protein